MRGLAFLLTIWIVADIGTAAETQPRSRPADWNAGDIQAPVDAVAYWQPELRPRKRPPDHGKPVVHCTRDRAHCIAMAQYIPDLCRTIEAVADENHLDPSFFARLIWRESLFDPGAVSPKGALGIAQFMPGTARLRDLEDPFNTAAALSASARYLGDLRGRFGNLGLAAAAYNAGEGRLSRYIAGNAWLPAETRAYVHAITGYNASTWLEEPPMHVDYRLSKGKTFRQACIARAKTRDFREFRNPGRWRPWGVIVAAHDRREVAQNKFARLRQRFPSVLEEEPPLLLRSTNARFGTLPRYTVRLARDTRAEADALCTGLRKAGGSCMVLKN